MLTLSSAGLAQTGSIEGVVTDKNSREALPGVTIIIDGTTTGTSADIEGHFRIPNVKPGKYRLKASYISYNPFIAEDVKVEAGKSTKAFNISDRKHGSP